jgi:hypothetical protein
MDLEARKAAFAEAKVQSIEALARTANVRVEHRDHSGEYWSRPKPAPAPVPQAHQPTVAEIEMLRSQDCTRFVDSRIEAHAKANEWHHEATLEAIGQALAEERKRMRAEIQEQIGLVRADISIEKAAERGDVVELPPFIERRRHG